MDWNGVIGSVASVINTALPLFFGAIAAEDVPTASIGPATLYSDNGTLKLGNFDATESPIMINFSTPPGDSTENLSVQLNFTDAFDAEAWIQQYTNGSVTVGNSPAPSSSADDGPLGGVWTFVTQSVLSIGNTITAVVNPSLTLNIRFDVGANVVILAAIGTVGVLGTTYLLTANTNAGQSGTRSGTIEPTQTADDGEYALALPTGLDFSQGIYGLQLQLPLDLSSGSNATSAKIKFETVAAKKREEILSAQHKLSVAVVHA